MARNGATKPAAVPDEGNQMLTELYDTLTEDEQGAFDLIGSLGFRADKTEFGSWVGLAMKGDDRVGPCPTIGELFDAVQRHVDAAAEEVEIYEDEKGPRLPGVPLVADQQILTAAGKFKAVSTEWAEKGKERKAALDDLKAICHAKPHLFKRDPNNSNAKIYSAGGMTIRVLDQSKEKIEVELDESEDGD